MRKSQTHTVIWNRDTNELDVYRCGMRIGRSYTTPTLLESINPYSLGEKLPEIYAEIRHIEMHGLKVGPCSRTKAAA
jgi:hypothetical protein